MARVRSAWWRMRTRLSLSACTALFLTIFFAGQFAPHTAWAQSLTVSGITPAPRAFSLQEIEALGLQEIRESREVTGSAGATRLDIVYSGVVLARLLEAAGIETIDRYRLRSAAIIVRASDGYQAGFSWGELFNHASGAGVLLITRENGSRLQPREGDFSLRATTDLRPGPRHVRLVSDIRIVLN